MKGILISKLSQIMEEKPFETRVEKSKGKAVYVKGLRVFEHVDGKIHITSSNGHTYCPKGSWNS